MFPRPAVVSGVSDRTRGNEDVLILVLKCYIDEESIYKLGNKNNYEYSDKAAAKYSKLK